MILYIYPIYMLVGLNGAAIFLASSSYPKIALVSVLFLGIISSFAIEKVYPYEPSWNEPHADVGRDWLHFIVNESSNMLSLAALPLLTGWAQPFGYLWPQQWPFVVQVLFAILIFDFGVTICHWASHKIDFLWRFHAVHHSVKRFYGFNGLMKHPVHQAIEMTAGIFPLLLIGLPMSVASALAVCAGIQLLMQHSNADYKVGPLRYVLALNQGHRFHHLKWAGVGDVNFGFFTNIWDYLLGTWSFDPNHRFTSDELGIAKEPDFPQDYIGQLLAPFSKKQ